MTGGNTNHYTTTDLGSKGRASRWSRVPCAAALLNALGRQRNRRFHGAPKERDATRPGVLVGLNSEGKTPQKNATQHGAPEVLPGTASQRYGVTWRARASGGRTQWAFSRAAVQFDRLSTIARCSQLGVVIRGAACVARARRILAPVASSRPRTERARELRKRRCEFILGTWCSGITSASHAEGPGFKSQCVHLGSCKRNGSKLGAR